MLLDLLYVKTKEQVIEEDYARVTIQTKLKTWLCTTSKVKCGCSLQRLFSVDNNYQGTMEE